MLSWKWIGLLAGVCLHAAQETELKDAAGKAIVRYVVEAPEGVAPAGTVDPAKQVGLFICSPEHDRPTGDEVLPVRESLRRLGLSDQFVVIGVHPQGQKFGPADHDPLRKLIAWAMKTYPVNPRRIYMYGKGEGAKISGEFGTTNPNLITAGITYSWGWWMFPSELKRAVDPRTDGPEYYMVLGLRDIPTHLVTVRDTYTRMQLKGYHTIYREFEDLGARTYHPTSNDDAIAWATRLRNKTLPLSAAERKLLTQPAMAGGYFPALALVGGREAGAVVRKLLESKDAAVRVAAAETCARAIFDEATLEAVAKRLADPVLKVRRTAINALAVNGQWRSQISQQALIAKALDTAATDQSDRVAAVDGLCQAVRLQLRGVRQDPPVFRALVALLKDNNEELRVMAANFLAPVRDAEFRGDIGRKEKPSPEGGWDKWLKDITEKSAGYRNDYAICAAGGQVEAVALFCKGSVPGTPVAEAFASTLKAAELGYVPAQAMVGMMYANGKGVQQSYEEASKWLKKAADGQHPLAIVNAARSPKSYAEIPAGAFLTRQ